MQVFGELMKVCRLAPDFVLQDFGELMKECRLAPDIVLQDFGELMKECRLAPGPGNTESAEASEQKPVDRGRVSLISFKLLFRGKLGYLSASSHPCSIV